MLIAVVVVIAALLVSGASSMIFTSVHVTDTVDFYDCVARATSEAARRHDVDSGIGIPPLFDIGCSDPRRQTSWVAPAASWTCLLLVIGCVYVWLPRWRTRRRGYLPLTGMPELSHYLDDLLCASGAVPRVTFLTNPLNARISALAFGRVRGRRVVLSGGLLRLFTLDRDAFRTVVLHEFAHIRNRDLDIAFLTLIVWRMFGPPLLAISALAALGSTQAGTIPAAERAAFLVYGVAVALLAVLVTLLKNAVLRSRELYADARVRSWEGSAESLQRLFARYSRPFASPAGTRLVMLRVHPPLALRVRALDDAGLLLGWGFQDMCTVGITTAFLWDMVQLGPVGGGSQKGFAWEAVASLIAAALLVGAVGATLWGVAADSSGHGPPADRPTRIRVGRAGIGVGLGLCLGCLLSPTGASSFVMVGDGRELTMIVPFAGVMCLCGWALSWWLMLLARTWTPVLVRNRHPRLMFYALLGVCTVGLAPSFDFLMRLPSMAMYAASFIAPSRPPALVFLGDLGFLIAGTSQSVLAPLVLTAASMPLVGHHVTWRRGRQHTWTQFGPPRWTGSLIVRFGLPAGLAAAVVGEVPLLLGEPISAWSLFALVWGAQILAALWAGSGYAPFPLPRGLLAAYSAGVLALVGWFVLSEALSPHCVLGTGPCHPYPSVPQAHLAVWGALPGAVLAWVLHAIFLALRHRLNRRPRTGTSRTPADLNKRVDPGNPPGATDRWGDG